MQRSTWHVHGFSVHYSNTPDTQDCVVGMFQKVNQDNGLLESPDRLSNIRLVVFPIDERDGLIEDTYERLQIMTGLECRYGGRKMLDFNEKNYSIGDMHLNPHKACNKIIESLGQESVMSRVSIVEAKWMKSAHDYGDPAIDGFNYRPGNVEINYDFGDMAEDTGYEPVDESVSAEAFMLEPTM